MADSAQQTSPTSAPDAAQAAAPGFDLSAIYDRLKNQAESEMGQAQAQRQAALQDADSRSNLLGLFKGPEAALAMRKALVQEADRPVLDVLDRHTARENAVKEAIQQGQVAAQGWQNAELQKRLDSTSDVSKAAQAFAIKNGLVAPELAPKLSAFALEQAAPSLKGFADVYSTRKGGEATASKTSLAEQAAPGERAKTAAETASAHATAEKTGAEAAKIRLETGGEIAPGWVPMGTIGLGDKQREAFRENYEANQNIHKAVDEIEDLTGGKDFVLDPAKRAQIQPRVAELLAHLKDNLHMRQLAGPELKFLTTMSADPTQITASNLLGWAHNGVRLQSFKDISDRKLETAAQTNGIGHARSAGGAPAGAAPPASERVRVRSKDGKVGSVPRAQLAQAIREGFSEVK